MNTSLSCLIVSACLCYHVWLGGREREEDSVHFTTHSSIIYAATHALPSLASALRSHPALLVVVVVTVKTDAADNSGFPLLEIHPLLVAVLKLAAVELALAVESHDSAWVPAVVPAKRRVTTPHTQEQTTELSDNAS